MDIRMVHSSRNRFPITEETLSTAPLLFYPWPGEKFILTPTPATWELLEYCPRYKTAADCGLLQENSVQGRQELLWPTESCWQLRRPWSISTNIYMDKSSTYAPTTPPWPGCWTLETCRDRQLNGFSTCRSTTSHLKTVKASKTLKQTPFPGDHAPTSASTAKRLNTGRTARGCGLWLLPLLMAETDKPRGNIWQNDIWSLMRDEAGQRPEWRDISDCDPIYKSNWAQWKSIAVRDGVLNATGNRRRKHDDGPGNPPQQGEERTGGDVRRHIRRTSWN